MHLNLLHLGRIPYTEGLAIQEQVVAARKANRIADTLLFLEHPPVLTLGRNSSRANILASDDFLAQRGIELHEINRGGDVTYHGPGQLVGYPIVDLRGDWPNKRGPFLGPVDFVRLLEEALIRTCADFGILAKRIPKSTGVWTFGGDNSEPATSGGAPSQLRSAGQCLPNLTGTATHTARVPPSSRSDGWFQNSARPPQDLSFRPEAEGRGGETCIPGPAANAPQKLERKLAAIGVHVSQGVTSHGFALNVTTDLRDFNWIIPCGIRDRGVTSLELEADNRLPVTMANAINSTARAFGHVFQRQILHIDTLETLLHTPTPATTSA